MRPAPSPRLTRAVIVLMGTLVIAGLVGSALAPMLLVKSPVLLLALSPDMRHVALAAGSVPPAVLMVVTVLRRALFSLGSYGLGFVYGEAAVEWVEQRYARLGKILRYLESMFARVGAGILLVLPLASLSIVAGAARTRLVAFAPAILLGHTLWVGSIYVLGTLIADITARVIAFFTENLLESTLVCVALVVLGQLLSRRRASKRSELTSER